MRVIGLLAVAAAALAAVQIVSPAVRADDAAPQEEERGTMIQIGPDHGVGVNVQVEGDRPAERRERRLGRRMRQPGFVEGVQAVSRFWIGIGGEPLPAAMRAQLDIDSDEGLLIRTVAEDSPAAEAGVKQYDILLRANGIPISAVDQLAEEVGEQGELEGRITLDLLRRGEVKTLWVKPVERPLGDIVRGPRQRQRPGVFGPEGVFGQGGPFAGQGFQFNEEMFGPEGFGQFAEMVPQMGVSVSVTRQGEGPAKVTVSSGDKNWEFEEGDKDAIAALPDDVRPTVERMLEGQGGVFRPGFEGFGINAPGFQMQLNGEGLAGRMRELQERMRALQGAAPADPADPMNQPQIELDEAPAFNPEAAPPAEVEGPTELEIPATE